MDVITELLRASLLSDLGDDEERVRRVRDAASLFGSQLAGESVALLPNAVLAAFDENTPPDSMILEAAAAALLDCWETFRNAFAGPPAELLRAVTLAGVVTAADRDAAILNAARYTLRNVVERVQTGRWSGQAQALLATWEQVTRGDIGAIWAPSPAEAVFKMPSISDLDPISFTNSGLVAKVKEIADNGGNYQTFHQNLQPELTGIVDSLISLSNTTGTEAQQQVIAHLRKFAASLGSAVRASLAAQDRGVAAARLRVDLLWWRQTGYSDGADRLYSELSGPAEIAVAAASDLHRLVADIAPRAVEHLLADLVATTAGADAAVDVAALTAASSVVTLPNGSDADTSPRLLVEAMATGDSTPLLADGQQAEAARVAVLLFRELQARRLTTRVVVPTAAAEEPGDDE